MRAGDTYWAASTSGDWSPSFPLFRSQGGPDSWKQVGSIFPASPAWAVGDFWAPELVNDRGQVKLYYAARSRNGVLCVAVATAPQPQGPYTDHGPLICQPDGSIDPSFIRDEQGKPFLIWKEDGNSRKLPSLIWAQELSDNGLQLRGRRFELIRNDAASWEGGVVEAPYVLRHGGWFYLFYAGNACCGAECHYAEGVARSRSLQGPWEKDAANPIIHDGNGWRCPGHGTIVASAAGASTWFLYHAYADTGGVYLAREAVLSRVQGKNGWPMVAGSEPPPARPSPILFREDFTHALAPGWQWPVDARPDTQLEQGRLTLSAPEGRSTVMLGRVITGPSYQADVVLSTVPATNTIAGLAVLGGAERAIVAGVQEGHVVLWELRPQAGGRVLTTADPVSGPVEFRVTATDPGRPAFAWRSPGGKWKPLPAEIQAGPLLAWDGGLRLGLLVSSPNGGGAVFRDYQQSSK